MSSYFDKFDREVRELASLYDNSPEETEKFLKALMELEKNMAHTCELFAGDLETPEDMRQEIIKTIALNAIRYDGGDFMGDSTACEATRFAAVCKRSKLSMEMHSLWHTIARARLTLRYGVVFDNPEHAVNARDRWVKENVR